MKYKKYIGALLAAAMLLHSSAAFASGTGGGMNSISPAAVQSAMTVSDGQLTMKDIQALNGGSAKVHKTKDGNVYFIEGTLSENPVENMEDAAKVVSSLTDILGGDSRMQFEPWRTFNDTAGNHYYVFQQMYADTTVSGGAIKVVTDADNHMTGLVCSVERNLPDEEASEGISAEEAESIVLQHEEKKSADLETGAAQIIDGMTTKIILPVNLELDPEYEGVEESRFVWVVYTNNTSGREEQNSDLPYLAHYVSMDGEYLYSLPTVIPGDEAGNTGFDASYAFEFMEPAEYTGTVEMSDGTQKEITVTLMRDKRTGMYYLGNIERKIAVADCYEFLYNKGNVVMEASPDNTGWDSNSLLALYNYCRAWDYYNEIGWKGGDGLETPMLILKDFCDQDHNPVDNAAYAGRYYGWQTFLSSSVNDLSGCLDVLAHEFTHCVTGSVMTYNAYVNDFGAINEAMSDIQGNICQMMAGDTEDTEWNLGEGSQMGVIRSMSDPHSSMQPEYSWDLYYVQNVKDGTGINDLGGVHTNSSLLNNVAYRLCNDGKMTLDEARSFWFAVDCSMVPGTDHKQLKELLPWVLKNTGIQKYEGVLAEAIDATKLGSDELPSSVGEDKSMVTLKLPDTENFNDGNWALYVFSLDPEEIQSRINSILEGEGEYATAFDELLEIVLGGLTGEADEAGAEEESSSDMMTKLAEWSGKYFGSIAHTGTGYAGKDGTTINMVCKPGYAIPVLLRLEVNGESMVPDSFGAAAYLFGKWIDLGSLADSLMSLAELNLENNPDIDLDQIMEKLGVEFDFGKVLDFLLGGNPPFIQIKAGENCQISADGIEKVKIMDQEWFLKLAPETEMDEEASEESAQAV